VADPRGHREQVDAAEHFVVQFNCGRAEQPAFAGKARPASFSSRAIVSSLTARFSLGP